MEVPEVQMEIISVDFVTLIEKYKSVSDRYKLNEIDMILQSLLHSLTANKGQLEDISHEDERQRLWHNQESCEFTLFMLKEIQEYTHVNYSSSD